MTTPTSRRSISARALFIALPIVALLAWGGLLLFTHYVPPQSTLAFIIFFTLSGMALFCTLAPLIHLVTRGILARRHARPVINHALREALLISIWIVFNLSLRVLHSWNFFTAIVSFGIIIVGEILALGRK
ncbi:MAG TPA: hypothetical protein VFV38_42020 [Ktedonobacteraceae bacterium]|nr:hypothetical protein [Ktedonobacteraceae bacterium]